MSRRQRHHKDHELTPYQQKLLDPRWQKKRLEILSRDEWACQRCFESEDTLHVHHRYYDKNKDPWDYQDSALVTLCERCHEEESATRYQEEQQLLLVLRKSGLWSDELHTLQSGFNSLEPGHGCEMAVVTIAWILRHPELMYQLEELHVQEKLKELGISRKNIDDDPF